MALPTDHSLSCDELYHVQEQKAQELKEALRIAEKTMENVLHMKHGRKHSKYPERIYYIAQSDGIWDDDHLLKYSTWSDVSIRYTSDIPVTEWDKLIPIPLFKPVKHCKICGVSDYDHKSWIGYHDSVFPAEHSDHKAEF